MSIDLLDPEYGLKDVTLDTDKYHRAFSNKKFFDRPSELAWNLWTPPNGIIRNDEWRAMFKTIGAGSDVQDKEFKIQRALLLPTRLSNPLEYYRGYMQAYLAISEHINAGEVSPLRGAMSTPCYNYVSAWRDYMNDLGFSIEHKHNKFERIERVGMSIMLVGDTRDDKKWSGPFVENAHFSRLGEGDCTAISVMHWVKFDVDEEWTIKDAKGGVISSSTPGKKTTRYLKFNSSARVAGVVFDALHHDAKKGKIGTTKDAYDHIGRELTAEELLDEQWQAKLYDIDNQVAFRAQDILYHEKIFYSPAEDQDVVWSAIKAL